MEPLEKNLGRFDPDYVQIFSGGSFCLSNHLKTAGELRRWLREIDTEVSSWGEDTEISEVFIHNGKITITLTKGIAQ